MKKNREDRIRGSGFMPTREGGISNILKKILFYSVSLIGTETTQNHYAKSIEDKLQENESALFFPEEKEILSRYAFWQDLVDEDTSKNHVPQKGYLVCVGCKDCKSCRACKSCGPGCKGCASTYGVPF